MPAGLAEADRLHRLAVMLVRGGSAHLGPSVRWRFFRSLGLHAFDDAELRSAFDGADRGGSGCLDRHVIRALLLREGPWLDKKQADEAAVSFVSRFAKTKDGQLSFPEFHAGITSLAGERDPRVWPIAGMMLVSGVAWGMNTPALPLLGLQLGLSHAQYGLLVSCFNLSRLVSNVPAAVFVDRRGRRAGAVCALVVQGLGMVGLSLAGSFHHALLARLQMGVGTSLHIAGASMAVLDMSTPQNRARMLAASQTAFAVGKSVGPAVGGLAIAACGLQPTLAALGAAFLLNSAYARLATCETLGEGAVPARARASASGTVRELRLRWASLARDPELRGLLLIVALYEFAHGGASMTLLPLMLAGEFALQPVQIGAVFALQSVVAVLSANPAAALADRLGPGCVLTPALAVIAASMTVFPMASSAAEAAAVLALWAAGNTLFNAAPHALAAGLVAPEARAQTIAVLRSAGDLGMLAGAASLGVAGSLLGMGPAMRWTALLLHGAAGWLAVRRWASR